MIIENMPVEKLAEMSLTRPDDFGYWGDHEMFSTWGFAGHNLTGMSSILEQANFKFACDTLIKQYPDDFRIERYSHWAAGWVEQLVCKVLLHKDVGIINNNISDAFKASVNLLITLQEDPVLDENIYYDMKAEVIFESIRDIPTYLLNMINVEDYDWVIKIIECLEQDLNIYIDPDAELYPKDSDILMAAYIKELWNPENIDLWEGFCQDNNLEFPPRKKNPNQLNLFGENN